MSNWNPAGQELNNVVQLLIRSAKLPRNNCKGPQAIGRPSCIALRVEFIQVLSTWVATAPQTSCRHPCPTLFGNSNRNRSSTVCATRPCLKTKVLPVTTSGDSRAASCHIRATMLATQIGTSLVRRHHVPCDHCLLCYGTPVVLRNHNNDSACVWFSQMPASQRYNGTKPRNDIFECLPY